MEPREVRRRFVFKGALEVVLRLLELLKMID
jgi:hypothetical protein